MKSNRLFVGNLPPCTEDDLYDLFGSYGRVTSVDIKTKANSATSDKSDKFGFVNIEIDDYLVKQCIQEFRDTAYKGYFISVSVAKESFLDKLKREREEAANAQEQKNQRSSRKVEVAPESEEFVIKKSKFKAPEYVPEEGEDLLIKKRNQGAVLENGKLKILGGTGAPVYSNNKKSKAMDERDPMAKQADQKRLESLNKKTEMYNQQKFAIKNALAQSSSSKNKKIVFDGDGDEGRYSSKRNRQDLFDNDDDEEEYNDDFAVKKQFEGKSGQKLLELKTKFRNDDRFRMDEDFQEHQEDIAEEIDPVVEGSERQRQLEILGSVVGKQFEGQNNQKKAIRNTMLRFDPSKESHKKFIKQRIDPASQVPADNQAESYQNDEPVVSSEKFFKVSDRIGDSLHKGEQQGFSLLGMMGKGQYDEEQDYPMEETPYSSEQIANSGKNYNNKAFKYDSSDDEKQPRKTTDTRPPKKQPHQRVQGKTNKRGLFKENFFILSGDARLEEGLTFFTSSSAKDNNRDFSEVRRELKKIVSRKVRKNLQKHKFGSNNRKPNKKFVKQRK